MSSTRKRFKLTPSKSQPPAAAATARSIRPPHSSPQLSSHDALLLPFPPAGGGAQEEEEEGYLLVEEDTTDSSLIITMDDSHVEGKAARRRAMRKRKKKLTEEEEEERGRASESEEEEDEEAEVEVEIDRQLDQSLETKSKQHNLTTVNVRNIIHEVITNEHVVAMMKAAINETEAVPPFELKMTRSKFKEVVEKGVVIPAWNISPIKKTSDVNKAPQFVDIPLAEEDSSDEEYRPDEEEEDETAEDTFQESDMESTASSPRGSRVSRVDDDSCSPWQTSRSSFRRLRARPVSMGPPPPPKAPPPRAATDSTFLEKLHAVEEELAVCMEPYQPLSESEDEVGLMAYRTRSKRPLRDVPLGRLEAELRAPDITPDMYDSSSAHEDREWTDWLRGLMTSDMENEEECDDEDDPEYNFLADIDEPDVEDYRDDKAVRITKKEVNELMEELFETLKEDLAGQEVEDDGHEEEEPQEEPHSVQTHTAEELHHTGPDGDGPVTELRTVKQQLASIRKRQQTHTLCNTHTHSPEPYTLKLGGPQRARLQQQLQQRFEIHPEMLKALDIVGLSLLTCLFSVTWRSDTVPAEWQSRVVIKSHCSASQGCWGGCGSLPIQSTCGLGEGLRLRASFGGYQGRRYEPSGSCESCICLLPPVKSITFSHVQLLTQIHLLSSPVVRLQSEAETTRQFLFELDLLAQRGELLMSSGRPGFRSAFRASNLQGALQLLEELQQTPISHQQQHHPPDARGHMRCYPVLPTELAWLFATRLVFLYPELLPCASLDPALYCPRRTAAFTAAEDCLLVLGLRNMEGSCDPTKLVSQFLLRKTLVQVRRRILQCCRPGSPDNIVKAFRYQRVLWPMMVACRPVEPSEQRPPVEREEESMPLWLLRSLPVIYPTIRDYNSPSGSAPEALLPCRSGGARQSHMTLRRSASQIYSFPPGTKYPPRLPKQLDFRRIGFVQLQQPLPPPPPDPAPLPDKQVGASPLPDGQVGASPLPDGQVGASPLPDRQVDASPLFDKQVDASPLPDGQVGASPLPDGEVGASPLPDGQVGASPLPDRQVGASPLPDRQVGASPLFDKQVGASPLPDRQVGASPLPDGQVGCPRALRPPQVLLRRLLLSRTDTPPDVISTATVCMTTRDRIRHHYKTLASLRKRRRKRRRRSLSASPPAQNRGGVRRREGEDVTPPLPPEGPAPSQVEMQEGDDVIKTSEEEGDEEEESEVLLALSESSSSSTESVALEEEAELESGQEVTLTPSRAAAAEDDDDDDDEDDEGEVSSDESILQLQEEESSEDDEGQRKCEDEAFAQDYLLRVCDAVQVSPGVSEQLLQLLDRSSAAAAEVLYNGLKCVLQPWPQLTRDFAAFLSRGQAHRCGLLEEQQLFERSRRFLRLLGRSLGEGSSLYQHVVSVLQASSTPPPEDMEQISSLLRRHSDLQEEFWEFFKQLHGQSSPVATGPKTIERDCITQNPPDGNRKRAEASDELERPVCAKNISMTSSGEKVIVWTREADRAILTACQQRGANQKTFRQVSTQLGNKTAQQVSRRFYDLMNLFHSAFQKGQPISRQDAARD
nr:GON-4-like protein isoform X2 [Epinephelus lanceolatus]XP_033493673.1 GON-4-like protein isoform X2 [Epinephelus lanceolatus]